MMIDATLTLRTILNVFTEEVNRRDGRVTDTFQDERHLFIRSLLPYIADARPKDQMQGGLALRATEDELWLCPYLFRQVCRNGAVMAEAIESLHVECLGVYSADEGTNMLREVIAKCSEKRVFQCSMRRICSSASMAIDWLNLIPYFKHFQAAGVATGFLSQILRRFELESDHTQFGLMNAVTSVARDTRNPRDRWRLEELGGSIGARVRPRQPTDGSGVRRIAPQAVPVA
jgi:hypothetical protein